MWERWTPWVFGSEPTATGLYASRQTGIQQSCRARELRFPAPAALLCGETAADRKKVAAGPPAEAERSSGLRMSGRQDLNLRPLGPEGPQGDPHGVVPGGTASYPFDNTGNAGDAGFHPVAPLPPDATPFGALVVQETPGPLLTVAEVAVRLRVSRATIYRLVRAGALPALRISNSIRVPTSSLGP